jgi:hypothetical protein
VRFNAFLIDYKRYQQKQLALAYGKAGGHEQ